MNWYKASLQKHMPAEQHQYSQCIAVKRYEQRGRDPIVKQALHDAVYHCALLTAVICLPLHSAYYCSLPAGMYHRVFIDEGMQSQESVRCGFYVSYQETLVHFTILLYPHTFPSCSLSSSNVEPWIISDKKQLTWVFAES